MLLPRRALRDSHSWHCQVEPLAGRVRRWTTPHPATAAIDFHSRSSSTPCGFRAIGWACAACGDIASLRHSCDRAWLAPTLPKVWNGQALRRLVSVVGQLRALWAPLFRFDLRSHRFDLPFDRRTDCRLRVSRLDGPSGEPLVGSRSVGADRARHHAGEPAEPEGVRNRGRLSRGAAA